MGVVDQSVDQPRGRRAELMAAARDVDPRVQVDALA